MTGDFITLTADQTFTDSGAIITDMAHPGRFFF
jgi:hypothetical protein